MIDIKLIRENRDLVKENIKKKFQDEKLPLVDEVYELDKKVREVQTKCDNLKAEKIYVTTNYGASTVFEFTLYKDKIIVSTKLPPGAKNFALSKIEWNGEVFIHTSIRTFFDENGVRAAFTRAQEKEWDGPDSIDDYC